MPSIPRVLTVAGSDSGGGAGIQADVRTATLLGCHATSAITAVTAQNTLGVQAVFPLTAEAVVAQLTSVLADIGADAAKTGMLFSAELITAVAGVLRARPISRLVVDPVMVAKGGASLLQESARDALVAELLPLAELVTPNLPEAAVLSGMPIATAPDRVAAGRRILDLGPAAVLIKGGHGDGEWVEDLLVTRDGAPRTFRSRRIDTPNTHGTGCTLSAAIAAYRARGLALCEAVAAAREFLLTAIREAYTLGKGHGPTNPYAAARLGGHNAVLERLRLAWEVLEDANPADLIPEVQANLAEALPGADGFDDVAAFPGRLIRCGQRLRRVDGPAFGASRHMAKILLASVRWGSPFRAVMNVRYGLDVLAACRRTGLTVEGFSRREEPPEVKRAEGSTLEWGTATVLARYGYAPDAIYDEGDVGKEPMIRIFGTDALDVAQRVAAVARSLSGGKGEPA